MADSGLFITLEGGEGAGKSLQARSISKRIEACGRAAVCTREPGGTTVGERLRELVLEFTTDDAPLDPVTETLIFLTARAALVANVIAPALARGDAVICDRYADSTRAYQGFGRGVDLQAIDRLNHFATQGVCPALTVLLDVPVEVGLTRTRAAGSDDRFGREAVAFHERVREGYLTLAGRDPERWLVVDATEPPGAVTDAIWRRLEPLL